MSQPLRVFTIPGSLRAHSTNLLLLQTAAILAPAGMHIEIFTGLGDLLLFNPDLSEAPASVASLRASIHAADTILISTPEYAHGLPGALKNALDWLVDGIEFSNKPVALFNASARSIYAQTVLREVLVTMGARFLDHACLTLPLIAESRSPQQLAADPVIAASISAALQRLADRNRQPDEIPSSGSQPIGPALSGWEPRPYPERRGFHGQYSKIEPLDPVRHATDLHAALCNPKDRLLWTYLSADPPAGIVEWRNRLETYAASADPLYFTLFDQASRAAGICAYLRITPKYGSIEVGAIHLSPQLQQTRAATEIQYLLMRHAFDGLGYRRYEWKCDALNAPSRRAALRLGFRFEGIFLKAAVYKQRNRDTAWFSVTDEEWPALRRAFELWLAPKNFDAEGRQLRSLASLRV